MDTTETQFARLAQQVAVMALQAAGVYNQAQAGLDLHLVLTPQRLASPEGRQASRDAIAKLTELTARHKEMFSIFMTQAMAQVLAAADELAQDRQAQLKESVVESINWNLAAQAAFYEGRGRWIASVSRLLDLIDENGDDIEFDGGTLHFRRDEALEEFNELVASIDAVHQEEVANLREREARVMRHVAPP